MSKSLAFTPSATVFSELKSLPNQLVLLFYGVSYILPVYSSIQVCLEVTKQRGISTFIINQEKERNICVEKNIVVGTPFLEVYYNEAPMYFSISDAEVNNWNAEAELDDIESDDIRSSSTSRTSHGVSSQKDDTISLFSKSRGNDAQIHETDIQTSSSNVPRTNFIGQLNAELLNYILKEADAAIKVGSNTILLLSTFLNHYRTVEFNDVEEVYPYKDSKFGLGLLESKWALKNKKDEDTKIEDSSNSEDDSDTDEGEESSDEDESASSDSS